MKWKLLGPQGRVFPKRPKKIDALCALHMLYAELAITVTTQKFFYWIVEFSHFQSSFGFSAF